MAYSPMRRTGAAAASCSSLGHWSDPTYGEMHVE